VTSLRCLVDHLSLVEPIRPAFAGVAAFPISATSPVPKPSRLSGQPSATLCFSFLASYSPAAISSSHAKA
jgi:hypothetical protein